ncbi:hypothetical protein NC653_035920 [Populus alba x Populus x berolinensis]|uniref:Uncharacterized protein n=1 Tax=Populus alba x Populus x berolinensis TaxID=444605 RepID=A0AAD6PUA8_9ROSI|nr:hypothetical protein NC653_035920 [Populus alba x Populus x berolinensis]
MHFCTGGCEVQAGPTGPRPWYRLLGTSMPSKLLGSDVLQSGLRLTDQLFQFERDSRKPDLFREDEVTFMAEFHFPRICTNPAN